MFNINIVFDLFKFIFQNIKTNRFIPFNLLIDLDI